MTGRILLGFCSDVVRITLVNLEYQDIQLQLIRHIIWEQGLEQGLKANMALKANEMPLELQIKEHESTLFFLSIFL